MAHSNRHGTAHGLLAAAEVVSVPLALVGTTVALAASGAAIVAIRGVGSLVGASTTVVEVLVWVVTVVTAVALLAIAGMVAAEYRRFVATPERTLDPIALVAVPLVALVGPYAFVAYTTGGLSLPLGLFLVVVLAAHALAFRTIGWFSRRDAHRREGVVAGVLAGVPITLALVSFVTTTLHVPGLDATGSLLVETLSLAAIPQNELVLVGYPVAISILYAGYRTAVTRSLIDGPTVPVETPRAPTVSDAGRWTWRRVGPILVRTGRFAHRQISRVLAAVRNQIGSSDSPSVPAPPRSARSSGSGSSAPSSRRRSRRVATGASSEAGGPRAPRSASSTGPSGTDDSEAAEQTASQTAGRSGDVAAGGESGQDEGDEEAAGDSGTERDASKTGSSTETGESESATETEETENVTAESAAESAGDDTPFSSDTEIFLAEPVAGTSGGNSVSTCPDCGEDLPSDGTFEFCPICGNEL